MPFGELFSLSNAFVKRILEMVLMFFLFKDEEAVAVFGRARMFHV